jgi:O-antigen/teichoic acid export membrane protein
VGVARRPSVAAQAMLSLFGNSSGYIVAIITGIVVARVLGPADKGIASYAALVMAVFTTFGNGLQAAILYECGRNGRAKMPAYAAAVRLLGLSMLPAAAGLLAVALTDPHYASFIYVACAVPFGVYTQIASGIFLLENDIRSIVIQGAIPTFGVAIFTIPALTLFHGGLTAVLAIWALSFVAAGAFGAVRLNAYLRSWSIGSSWELVREQGIFALKSGSTSVAAFLNLRIDVFVVGMMLDARTLGIYTLAVATGELMWQISRPLTVATSGRIASAERPRAIALTAKVARHILAIEFVLGLVIFVAAPFAVRIVYGRAYDESGDVVRWLLPGLILYAAQTPLAYFVTVKEGKPMATLGIQVACAVACATITTLTIHRLNIFGAALATTMTYCCAAAANAYFFVRYTGAPLASFTFVQREDVARAWALLRQFSPLRHSLPDQLGAESS